ncbi:MAG TPA: 1,4-dihydroxy-6-naphthoate synthase [Spirochaetota bacterium]|nr:1,4-dihydroxy-6-naphthoate synthase [Spirochaetota bacterium]
MKNVNIAFSPCPNDTFIFHAMLHGLVDTGDYRFTPHLCDIETLNDSAFTGRFDITKLSFHAYLYLKNKYDLLNAGSALGFGCGPLLIKAGSDKKIEDMAIAIPGEYTTAYMLLRLWKPEIKKIVPVRFDRIMDGVKNGKYDAGLIIHEGRFVYRNYGLSKIIDLGEWWERETSCPIPLGCITIKNDRFTKKEKEELDAVLKSSVRYAFNNRDASKEYIKLHSQELDDDVIENHIKLYVNEFSIDLGETGRNAVNKLEEMARERHIIS